MIQKTIKELEQEYLQLNTTCDNLRHEIIQRKFNTTNASKYLNKYIKVIYKSRISNIVGELFSSNITTYMYVQEVEPASSIYDAAEEFYLKGFTLSSTDGKIHFVKNNSIKCNLIDNTHLHIEDSSKEEFKEALNKSLENFNNTVLKHIVSINENTKINEEEHVTL